MWCMSGSLCVCSAVKLSARVVLIYIRFLVRSESTFCVFCFFFIRFALGIKLLAFVLYMLRVCLRRRKAKWRRSDRYFFCVWLLVRAHNQNYNLVFGGNSMVRHWLRTDPSLVFCFFFFLHIFSLRFYLRDKSFNFFSFSFVEWPLFRVF